MSIAISADPAVGPAADEAPPKRGAAFWLLLALAVLVLVSGVRVLTGVHDVTSSGTLRAALVGMIPIALAGLGGLWSERAGVVNIGLEGMLIVGTLGGAYFGYHYGIVAGVVGAMLFGLLAACLHALATVLLGVDHIVSGVAINIIAAGLSAFLAKVFFSELPGGGPTQSPPIGKPWTITLNGLYEPLRALEVKHWFLVSDLAAVGAAVTRNLSVLTVIALLLFVATWWILWHTAFGLRLRSTGESPTAAESLGVPVYTFKIVAVATSGALAGLGGAYLAMVSASGYSNGLSQNMGYIGLAAMIFGNWRPGGLLLGASLFGYTQSLRLRPDGGDSLHTLLLVIAIVLLAIAVIQFRDKRIRAAVITIVGAVVFAIWFTATDAVPRDLTGMAPYVTTLLVLTFAAQKLRMPAADGQIYRKGSAG